MRKILILTFVAVVAWLVFTTTSASPVSAAGPAYYVVRPGDTLFGIAARYGVSAWAIARANGIWNPNIIFVGQALLIPSSPYPPYPPGPIYNCTYRVQYGDTLYSIAARLHVNVWTLAQTNGIYNINWIYAGQWLRVPGCSPNPVPQRRNVSGTWVSGNYSLELSEAIGCPGPVCAVTGRLIEARGTTTPDIRDVQGTINVNTGAISVIIAMPGAQGGFTGTIDANSRTMSGQLSGVGWLTFTKR